MLNFTKRQAASQGYKTISLWTKTSMGAFHLCRKNGFKIMGEAIE